MNVVSLKKSPSIQGSAFEFPSTISGEERDAVDVTAPVYEGASNEGAALVNVVITDNDSHVPVYLPCKDGHYTFSLSAVSKIG